MEYEAPQTTAAHEPLSWGYPAVLAVNVQRLRKRAGFSKKTFAMMTRMGRPFLNRVESGQANPRLDYLERMATALGVTPADLLTPPFDDVPPEHYRLSSR